MLELEFYIEASRFLEFDCLIIILILDINQDYLVNLQFGDSIYLGRKH